MKHRHEYTLAISIRGDPKYYMCDGDGCDHVLYFKDVETRLAATEALSAEDARDIAFELHKSAWSNVQDMAEALREYAKRRQVNDG